MAILALLARDASAAELQAVVAELLDRAADDERSEIIEVGRYASEVQRAREEDRRRARGLTALSDTAADLAGRRDIDELLTAICRRARLLLSTDVAYITLWDPVAGDTYVHTTDGIVSEPFRSMRLPTGTGLGGLVAQTGLPEATADYVADQRLRHDRDVDRRVAVEGLRAIVAAPLMRANEVIGVLLSGSREVRQFDPAEVALFVSLASHAAIALENARLIQGSKQTLADLEHAHQALQRHALHVERVGDVYAELAAIALGGDIHDLLDAVARQIPGEIELRSPTGELVHASTTANWAPDSERWLDVAVAAGSDELGALRMRSSDDDALVTELLQRTSVILAGVLLARQAQTDAEHRHRGVILEELLAAHRTPSADLQRRAVRAGIPLHNEVLVLAIEVDESAQRWAWLRATRIATDRSATVGTVGGRLVVIDADGDPHAAAAAWAAGMQSQGGARPTIGIATGAIGAAGIRAAHRDASAALSILLALERTGSSATSAELGFFGQMLVHARPGELAEFLGRTLGAVKAYDAERATDLLPTLDAVLTHEGHHANAARSLGIHVNTLYQRLERLDEVLGEGWRDADRRLELHLAVRLHSVERKLDRA